MQSGSKAWPSSAAPGPWAPSPNTRACTDRTCIKAASVAHLPPLLQGDLAQPWPPRPYWRDPQPPAHALYTHTSAFSIFSLCFFLCQLVQNVAVRESITQMLPPAPPKAFLTSEANRGYGLAHHCPVGSPQLFRDTCLSLPVVCGEMRHSCT